MNRFFRSALFPLIVIVFLVFCVSVIVGGCGEESAEGEGCVGTVTKTYTEFKEGVGVVSGGISLPSGSTRYYIAIEKSDGTFCSKRLDKNEWLGVKEGDSWPEV